MGAWGKAPWENDKADDWFSGVMDRSELPLAVEETLKRDVNQHHEEVRAAAYILVALGRVFIWPVDRLDAHLKLPTIDSTWEEMHRLHLPPFFAAIAEGLEAVMTSHPVYPNLDPSGVPATFSRLLVHDYLRGEVGFRGVIVSGIRPMVIT